MALSIMLYHLGGRNNAATPLGRLGIYGVSIFFILSGLSMAIAYDRYIKDLRSGGAFFVRRLFRIWPLLWVAVALVAAPAYFSAKPFSAKMIGLNLSTLFGFVAPTQYINMGAWSIGNEMVYYAFTPIFIAVYHWRKSIGNVITLATVCIGMLFAFRLIDSSATLESQWSFYVNPFNNLFLYSAGLAIYYNFREVELPRSGAFPLLLVVVIMFLFYPASGDQISIVAGINRVAMSLISVAIVVVFYKCPPFLPAWFGEKFEQLGIATYGVYLLHPIVMGWTRNVFQLIGINNSYLFVFLVIGLTIGLALITFKVYEAPLIGIGKRLTQGSARKSD